MRVIVAARRRKAGRILLGIAVLGGAASCSPGTLPGTPSPISVGAGGARYNGSFTVRRVGGGTFTIMEGSQSLDLSIVMRGADQMSGRFQAGENSGTLQGTLTGSLAIGSFEATALISTVARQGASTTTCEGRSPVTGAFAGANISWTLGSIAYDNCPGLTAAAQAQAVAVSPIPGDVGDRANVVITVLGGSTIQRGTCPAGVSGFPFTVEMAETAGKDVTFDSTFTIEERRNFGIVSSSVLDMPFTDLAGGSRRTYSACSVLAGTYQAFFSGADSSGNRIRVASPLVTMGP